MSVRDADARPRSGERLELHVDRVGAVLVITPTGVIDLAAGALLVETVVAAVSAGEARVVVDLSLARSLESASLATFLRLDQVTREIGGQLSLVAGPAVADTFRAAWMDRFFPIHPDLAAAVAAFGAR